jgi:transposase
MKTINRDVRERILKSYDQRGRTRAEVAAWFGVSLGMVKKLLQQRRRIGEIGPLHHRAGRKPQITQTHRMHFRVLLKKQPDLTLAELRTATGLNCSLPAICYVLSDMQLTLKKRRFAPVNKTDQTLPRPARPGRPKAALGM